MVTKPIFTQYKSEPLEVLVTENEETNQDVQYDMQDVCPETVVCSIKAGSIPNSLQSINDNSSIIGNQRNSSVVQHRSQASETGGQVVHREDSNSDEKMP